VIDELRVTELAGRPVLDEGWSCGVRWAPCVSLWELTEIAFLAVVAAIVLTPGFPNVLLALVAAVPFPSNAIDRLEFMEFDLMLFHIFGYK